MVGGFNNEEEGNELADLMIDDTLDEKHGMCDSLQQLLGCPPIEFVDGLSKINVIKNASLHRVERADQTRALYAGGSKDAVSFFNIKCQNNQYGCQYEDPFWSNVSTHEIVCKFISHEAAVAVREAEEAKRFACDQCSARLTTRARLRKHIQEVHSGTKTSSATWTPQRCDKPGCNDPTVFLKPYGLRKHIADHHRGKEPFKPTSCPVEDCTSKTVFKERENFNIHLKLTHKMTADERRVYTGARPYQSVFKANTTCPVPGCTHPTKYLHSKNLRKHLEGEHHNFSYDQVLEYMPYLTSK